MWKDDLTSTELRKQITMLEDKVQQLTLQRQVDEKEILELQCKHKSQSQMNQMKNDLKKTIQSNKTLWDELAKTRKENEELNDKKKQALSNLQSKINTIKRMKAMEDDVKIKQEMWEHEKARM